MRQHIPLLLFGWYMLSLFFSLYIVEHQLSSKALPLHNRLIE